MNLFSSAKDTAGKMSVAVKKLSRPFQSDIHAKRAYREYRLLKQLCHENVRSLFKVYFHCHLNHVFCTFFMLSLRQNFDINFRFLKPTFDK